MNKCPYCKSVITANANFCPNCGDSISPPQSENVARVILCDESGKALQEYLLEKPKVSIGRSPSGDIVLTRDKLTSRHHATISYVRGRYVLRDEHSASGTYVNGQQIDDTAPYLLHDGDHIGLGEHELVFHEGRSLLL